MDNTKVELDIEREVQARVDFKMNELLTGLKNTISANFSAAIKTNNPKYSYYWEAFTQFDEMVKKERDMGTPYNDMAKRELEKKRNNAVTKLSNRLLKRGAYDYHEKERFIVGVVEDLLNI